MIAFIARKMDKSKLRLECENHDFFWKWPMIERPFVN